jgi:hypothetical protein
MGGMTSLDAFRQVRSVVRKERLHLPVEHNDLYALATTVIFSCSILYHGNSSTSSDAGGAAASAGGSGSGRGKATSSADSLAIPSSDGGI